MTKYEGYQCIKTDNSLKTSITPTIAKEDSTDDQSPKLSVSKANHHHNQIPYLITAENDNKKHNHISSSHKQKPKEMGNKVIRVDAYGTIISKDKRRHKVTFIDRLNPCKLFYQEDHVESYKEFNLVMSYPDQNNNIANHAECNCCLIW